MNILELTSDDGLLLLPDHLAKAEIVHRQLRPQLPENYVEKMTRVFANGGRMIVAERDGLVGGLAVYRIVENTAFDRQLYVDDLVTAEVLRSKGIGRALLIFLQDKAKKENCGSVALDSGTQRQRAHQFYFREGFLIPSFHFGKAVD
jgi:GNAT superfamily N-acetyltransferase